MLKFKLVTGELKIGIEVYGKVIVAGEGSGTIDQCKHTGKISVCASGELKIGIRGGVLEWPFEIITVQAYVYGEGSGKCKLCAQYDNTGFSLGDTGCKLCAGWGVLAKFKFGIEAWEYKYEQKWCIST